MPAAYQQFAPLPSDEPLRIDWPTPNRFLRTDAQRYFARTRANPDYGRPGWTRDCGRRFHRGADIAPLYLTPTGQRTCVVFTNCTTGQDYESHEPTFTPHDDVFAIYTGTVTEANSDDAQSDFGRYIILQHRWPRSGELFLTLYAHLAEVLVRPHQTVTTGQLIGRMGQTSRDSEARNWLQIAPHLHFEVRRCDGAAYDPAEFLRRYLPP